ncbi:hypothetical protein ABZV77_28535 [Streptomyces sp. NPDC004732]|uniref:hypothetical protein n=1 Tax=Streptomyces sp. NPDC004732 TaxID=3154290 RepID=UPI0033B34CF8
MGGLLLALVGTGVVVRLVRDDDQVASQLPAGWRDWTAKDAVTAAEGKDPSPSGPFVRCTTARGGLICAGDDVKAVRFSLATGKRESRAPASPASTPPPAGPPGRSPCAAPSPSSARPTGGSCSPTPPVPSTAASSPSPRPAATPAAPSGCPAPSPGRRPSRSAGARSATHVFVASPSGRLAALDGRTGDVAWTRPGRGVGSAWIGDEGARLTLAGDALYIPYGTRSVYTVDVRHP